jgi:L-ascorbate metabolism protein UlaG (beta-lactamase superfamily)
VSVPVDRRLDPRSLEGTLRIDPLETPHAGIGHNSYLVTWHGRRLYFSGDTDDATTLLGTKQLDVAFVSPWLYKRAAGRIDARRIMIYHHTASEQVTGCTGSCAVPRQGVTLRF